MCTRLKHIFATFCAQWQFLTPVAVLWQSSRCFDFEICLFYPETRTSTKIGSVLSSFYISNLRLFVAAWSYYVKSVSRWSWRFSGPGRAPCLVSIVTSHGRWCQDPHCMFVRDAYFPFMSFSLEHWWTLKSVSADKSGDIFKSYLSCEYCLHFKCSFLNSVLKFKRSVFLSSFQSLIRIFKIGWNYKGKF